MVKKKKSTAHFIAENRKARHDYFLEECFEAGLALEGWEVKSIRFGHVQLKDSYIIVKKGEAFLIGSHITPLKTVSAQSHADPYRTRKLLLNERELDKVVGATQRQGYTVVPLNLHWKKQWIKLEIALAKGKKSYDKRQTEKARDWQKEKSRLMTSFRP
jgi:SsrA-binding protein